MFKVGDKVVCIQKKWRNISGKYRGDELDPVYNNIYVVNDIESKVIDGEKLTLLHLIGIECYYVSRGFRKVEPKRFTNAITKELALEAITEEKRPQTERVETKEKELI